MRALFLFLIVCLFCGGEVWELWFCSPLESEMQDKDLKVGPVWDLKCFTQLKIQNTTLNLGDRLCLCDCEFSSSPAHLLSLAGRSFAADPGQSLLRKCQSRPEKRQRGHLQQRPAGSRRPREITHRCVKPCVIKMARLKWLTCWN